MINSLFNIIFIIIFNIFDFVYFIFIKFAPSKYIFSFLKRRPFRIFSLRLKFINNQRLQRRIKILMRSYTNWSLTFSSCLSKAITLRMVFDFCGIEHELNIGMIKENNKKFSHIWISSLDESFDYLSKPCKIHVVKLIQI